MDETGLFNRLGPNYTLRTQMAGTKCSKDRISMAHCGNTPGIMKIRPLIIAKAKRTRCFGRGYDPEAHVMYHWNSREWMLSTTFEMWLHDFDRQMA